MKKQFKVEICFRMIEIMMHAEEAVSVPNTDVNIININKR